MTGALSFFVRPEQPSDHPAIRSLLEAAFGRSAEANLVDALRASGMLLVSLVATSGSTVIGHIAFSPVTLDNQTVPILGLAPLSVHPSHQRQGAGSLLAFAGLNACRDLGASATVVLGDPSYYSRFGFSPASSFGLRSEYDVPPEAFQAIELQPASLSSLSGLIRYRPEFANMTD